MTFSTQLQFLRQQHGFSQEELADRLGVARQTIGKWESGQAQPELQSLITLCDLFHLSLDSLIRPDDCTALPATATSTDSLIDFLLLAKRSTYASHAPEIPSSRPASHDFLFEKDNWRYQDSYLGGRYFVGEEIVWHDGSPVWGMNYAGQVTGEPFSGDFLKEALLHGTASQPYRGPLLFRQGIWTYHCHTDGSPDWFSGFEEIYHQTDLVYRCQFHGSKLG